MNILSSLGICSLAQGFVYLLLFSLPFPLNVFPYVSKIAELYDSI